MFLAFLAFFAFSSFFVFVAWLLSQTCSAPQNDRLNLSFVKDMNVVGKKMARNGRKTAI